MVLQLSSFPLRPAARERSLLGISKGSRAYTVHRLGVDFDQPTRGVEDYESLQCLHRPHPLEEKGDPRDDVREAPSMWSWVYSVVM